ALATAISMMFPRLTWPCYLLATFTCLARMLKGAHYLSDVAAGALLATLGVRLLFPIFQTAIHRYLPSRTKM
ncbi:MAG: phosphatase PAP2 family protein, partial [Phycisphaerae bacterium]|nr:phosphatase PAP2 family protein [Phycisphaerae bacterium]